MTQPNQPDSVEEMISGIMICVCKNRGNKELCQFCGKPTVKAQVRKIITQAKAEEREKLSKEYWIGVAIGFIGAQFGVLLRSLMF